MGLGGPTLIAIDQIDSIVAASNLAAEASFGGDETESAARAIIHLFGNGLIDLKGITARSMTVVSCLGETWTILRERVLSTVHQRFSEPVFLRPASADNGQISDLIASRLRPGYAQLGDAPPYATWPFTPQAIAKLGDALPRKALMLCENFRQKCLALGKVSECLDFEDGLPSTPAPEVKTGSSLDAKFLTLKASAAVESVSADAGDGNACGELISEA